MQEGRKLAQILPEGFFFFLIAAEKLYIEQMKKNECHTLAKL